MPTSIQITDANFTYYIDRVPPFYNEAAGLWFMGSEAESRRNLITGLDGTVVGTPIFGTAAAELNLSNGIDTGISLAYNEDKTFIVVGTGGVVGYAGTWHSGNQYALMYSSANTAVGAAMLGSGVVNTTVAVGATVRFMAATYENTSGVQAAYASNSGALLTNSSVRGPHVSTLPNTFRIGACGLASGTGAYQCSAAMLFRRALSAAELASVYDYMKFKLKRRGIVVA